MWAFAYALAQTLGASMGEVPVHVKKRDFDKFGDSVSQASDCITALLEAAAQVSEFYDRDGVNLHWIVMDRQVVMFAMLHACLQHAYSCFPIPFRYLEYLLVWQFV